jgi:hypothetical protein
MPVSRSNSGNSCSYAPLKPPDIRTFNCADAAVGQSKVAMPATIVFIVPGALDENVLKNLSSQFPR